MSARRRHYVTFTILAAAFTAVGAGCWTSAQTGEELRKSGQENARRIAEMEKSARAEQEQVNDKLEELRQELKQTSESLTRSSADRGAQTDQIQDRLAALEGQLAELQHSSDKTFQDISSKLSDLSKRVDQLARKIGIDIPMPSSEIPADKTAHFNAAAVAFNAGDYSKSRALFREYLARYPDDDNADNALYWIGSGYLAEGKPATALGEFRKVISDYGKGDAVDPALLDMAEAFFQLHACSDAKSALETLLGRKLSKELQRSAKQKLEDIKKAAPAYCTS